VSVTGKNGFKAEDSSDLLVDGTSVKATVGPDRVTPLTASFSRK
jgi:hypothetical protein